MLRQGIGLGLGGKPHCKFECRGKMQKANEPEAGLFTAFYLGGRTVTLCYDSEMSGKAVHSLIASILVLILLGSEFACSAKNFPRGQRKRRPSEDKPAVEQAEEQQTAEKEPELPVQPEPGEVEPPTPAPTPAVGGDEDEAVARGKERPANASVKAGQMVPVLGSPKAFSLAFQPKRQTPPAGQDRYAVSLKGTQSNPRLYFNASELAVLQTQALGPQKDIAKAIFAFADAKCRQKKSLPPTSVSGMGKSTGSWRRLGDRLLGVASAYAFATDPAKKKVYLDWCVEAMRRFSKFSKWGPTPDYDVGLDGTHIMLGFAIAYDVTYPVLSEADRKQFAARLRDQAIRYYKEAMKRDPIFWVSAKNVNHNFTNYNALLNAALVLENRYPEARDWIAAVVKNVDHVMEFRKLVGDGSTHEGLMYASYGSHGLFATLDLLKRHDLADHFDNPWLRQNFLYYLHGTRPGWMRVIGNADGHGFFGHGPHHLFYFLDRIMRDGRPTWASDRIRKITGPALPFGKPEGSTLFFEMIWRDNSITPRSITAENTPTFHHFKDWDVVTFRRNWDANSTFFSFRAGDPPGHAIWNLILRKDPRAGEPIFSHSHPDAGSFTFYPNGNDFISGALYEMPKRTALENTYTFTPSTKFDPPVPQAAVKKFWDPAKLHQVGRLDELGQAGEWNRWYGPAKAIIKEKVHAEVIAAVSENGAMFVSGEIAESYPESFKANGKKQPFGLKRLYRNMLLLPEDVLVIVDRIETTKKMAAHCYFRSESKPDTPVLWTTTDGSATLKSSKSSGSTVDLVHPTGMTMETGLEIYSWEDAKGDNKGGIKNWSEVAQSSAYVRASNSNQTGAQTYVYLLRPNGKAAQVRNLNLQDANGVSFEVVIGNRAYQAKIAMDLRPPNRQAYLGFDGHCKLDFVQQ